MMNAKCLHSTTPVCLAEEFALRFLSFCSLGALAIALGASSLTGAEKAVPTISVAKTESGGIAGWQPAVGDGLAQMLITELSKLSNFKVLESVALDDLRAERQLGDSGEVAASESVKKGQWLGADYTLKSTVTRFGSKENNFGGVAVPVPVPVVGGLLGGFRVRKTENEVQIDWRIIDNATREVIPWATGRADAVEKGGGGSFGALGGGGVSGNREFMASALGKATMKALAQIMADISKLNLGPGARTLNNQRAVAQAVTALRSVRGVVKLVDGTDIWVSLGSANDFAKGDKIKIYKPIEKKNKKGEVVTTKYEPVAEIILTTVQKDTSMGQYKGPVHIEEDWAAADAAVDLEKGE